jgi:hypothetical protein
MNSAVLALIDPIGAGCTPAEQANDGPQGHLETCIAHGSELFLKIGLLAGSEKCEEAHSNQGRKQDCDDNPHQHVEQWARYGNGTGSTGGILFRHG